jgi:hypothetical protein
MGNGKEKGSVKQTPGQDDIPHAVAVHFWKVMSVGDSYTEGKLQWGSLHQEELFTLSILLDADADSSESDGKSYSEHHLHMAIRREHDMA